MTELEAALAHANNDRCDAHHRALAVEISRLRDELARVSTVAGDYLGTDPEMQTSGCVDALVIYAEQLRANRDYNRNVPRTHEFTGPHAECTCVACSLHYAYAAVAADRDALKAERDAFVAVLDPDERNVVMAMARAQNIARVATELDAANAQIDNLAHQATHVTYRMERDALAKQTCDTCARQWQNPTGHLCGKVSIPGHSVALVLCSMLGGGCRAWREKEAGR